MGRSIVSTRGGSTINNHCWDDHCWDDRCLGNHCWGDRCWGDCLMCWSWGGGQLTVLTWGGSMINSQWSLLRWLLLRWSLLRRSLLRRSLLRQSPHVLILGGLTIAVETSAVETINSQLKLLHEKAIASCVDPGGGVEIDTLETFCALHGLATSFDKIRVPGVVPKRTTQIDNLMLWNFRQFPQLAVYSICYQ